MPVCRPRSQPTIAKNSVTAGVYGYGQHETDLFGVVFNDGSSSNFTQPTASPAASQESFSKTTTSPPPGSR